MGELRGKVVVVTGASRGIGRALALRFAAEGANVVLVARTIVPGPDSSESLEDLREFILTHGGKATAHGVDLCDASAICELFARVEREQGGADCLVHNAGALLWAPIVTTQAEHFDHVMGVNARAAFLCAHHALPRMVARGRGHVINMAPPRSTACTKNRAAYMISKFAVTLLTESIAAEHGRDGVMAHALWPVTLVASDTVAKHHAGDPTQWRRPEIIVDAAMALLTGRATVANGSAAYDEDVLASAGITDFARYACVAGSNPPPARLDDSASYWRQ
jgi:citronellol/citronellal dehydrogenase